MKKSSGFTLLEVVLALFILVSAVSILTSLHLRLVNRLQISSEKINRIFLVQKNLFNFYLKYPSKDKPSVEKIENPDIKITTQLVDIDRKSALNDFKDFVKIAESEGEWKSGPDSINSKMTTLVLIPEQEKKN